MLTKEKRNRLERLHYKNLSPELKQKRLNQCRAYYNKTKFKKHKNVVCIECGKKIWKGGSRCLKCSNHKLGLQHFGEGNPMWKGGLHKELNGSHFYYWLYAPNHPYGVKRGTSKYILLHRYKIEQTIGRFLTPTEIVHHKNGDTTDNRLCNLQLLNNLGEHNKIHAGKEI